MNDQTTRPKNYLNPLIYGLLLGTGLLGGWYLSGVSNRQSGKINEVMEIISSAYVDSLNDNLLENQAVQALLEKLDPHSVFIDKQQLARYNMPLDGNFEGIGIEYNVQRDTVMVMRVLPNGPAQKAGLQVGDKLLSAGGISLIALDTDSIVALIKGPSGSKVTVGTLRNGKKPFDTVIIRGKIDVPSIPAYYMLNNQTAYLKLDQFSATTTKEFEAAVVELKKTGMKAMVFDLRNNTGGYLQAAIDVLDAFFDGKKLLSYTADRNGSKTSYYSKAGGSCTSIKLVVLVNGNSASASELFSGAVQDHKRGVIIGQRTFGKGLVQESFGLTDGSVIRLTVARYYTPKGRCIQKKYDGLVAHGDADVGGIIPDIEPEESGLTDTSDIDTSAYYHNEREVLIYLLNTRAAIFQAAGSAGEMQQSLLVKQQIQQAINQLWPGTISTREKERITNRTIELLVRNYYGEKAFYQLQNSKDPWIEIALKQANR